MSFLSSAGANLQWRRLPDVSSRWEVSAMEFSPHFAWNRCIVDFYVTRKDRVVVQSSCGREIHSQEHVNPRTQHRLSIPLTLCRQPGSLEASILVRLADLGVSSIRSLDIAEEILSFIHGVVGGPEITKEYNVLVDLVHVSTESTQELARGKILNLWGSITDADPLEGSILSSSCTDPPPGNIDFFLTRKREVYTVDNNLLEISTARIDEGTSWSHSIDVPPPLLSQPRLLQAHIESSLTSLSLNPSSMQKIARGITSYIRSMVKGQVQEFYGGVDLEIVEEQVRPGNVRTCRSPALGKCTLCLDDLWCSHGKQWLKKMPCAHVFHNSCFNRWRSTSRTCPSCDD